LKHCKRLRSICRRSAPSNRRTQAAAKEQLEALHDQHREIEENLIGIFGLVLETAQAQETDAAFGHQIRKLLADQGGVEALAEQCETVSAWHRDNDLPLLWPIHARYRSLLFPLLDVLDIQSATHDASLLDALALGRRLRHARRTASDQRSAHQCRQAGGCDGRRDRPVCPFPPVAALGRGRAAIADGTHVKLRENNLLGSRHLRYGGRGGIAYHHIAYSYIALFTSFITCGVWEAVYILDALLKNRSAIRPDTLHTDTQGQSEPVFGLCRLLGIKLMPRMRGLSDASFYRPAKAIRYQHIDAMFGGEIDWELIAVHARE
jgi:hypothetical protein